MKLRSWRQVSVLASLAVLAVAVGCSGVGAQGPENGGQQLPFTEGKPVVVPANTILYVRLHQAITAARAQAGQSFTAVLDEPLLVDNQTIVPQGAEVTGRVVAARESGRLHTAGYVRITLSSITVNGKTIAMQTNSAMAGGGVFKNRDFAFLTGGGDRSLSNSFQATDDKGAPAKKEAGFDADQRIGFRLTQSLTIS
ncbi:MAG TPA: hypothetical protein VI488_07675 [Candidatus Angelobacter sp.]